jgi:hypothetical protein
MGFQVYSYCPTRGHETLYHVVQQMILAINFHWNMIAPSYFATDALPWKGYWNVNAVIESAS